MSDAGLIVGMFLLVSAVLAAYYCWRRCKIEAAQPQESSPLLLRFPTK
jgi:hypothetical protein